MSNILCDFCARIRGGSSHSSLAVCLSTLGRAYSSYSEKAEHRKGHIVIIIIVIT